MNRFAALAFACLLGGALLVGAGLGVFDDRAAEQESISPELPTDGAACGPVLETPVESADHVDGPITYPASPPAAGDHRDQWAYYARNFYEVTDRPEVGVLVHNLEHGYNVLWYDETVIEDPALLAQVRMLAESYDGPRRDPATALIAAPWTSDDGPPFPAGMHFALTHWYADPEDPTRSRAEERGFTQYCGDLSAETVARFMEDYPLTDAPEGFPGNM